MLSVKLLGSIPPFASIILDTVPPKQIIDGVVIPTGLIYRFLSKLPMIKPQSPLSRNTARLEDLERWTYFREGRKRAIEMVTHGWSTGEILGRPLTIPESDKPHSGLCDISDDLEAHKRCLEKIAPLALAVLADSPSRPQRFDRVGKVVHAAAEGCPVCEDRLKGLYRSGLRQFCSQFPEII